VKVIAVFILTLAVLIAAVPQFTDCQSQGSMLTLQNGKQVPMKCHWTARAELALGIPLFAVGLLMPFSRRKESRRNLGIVGAILGGLAIVVPTTLIGVCANPDMTCNSVMKPALILMGVLVVGASLASVLLARGPERVA